MFMQSGIISRFLIIIFLGAFAVTSVMMPEDAFAQRRDQRIGQSPRGSQRAPVTRSRRHIVSPPVKRYGYVAPELPRGYRRTWYRRTPYYYYRGVFYRHSSPGFVVVGPPIGAIVVSIPIGYTRIWVGGTGYYAYGGVFYRRVPSGYLVVDPPDTLIIEEDPPELVEPDEAASGKVAVNAETLNVRSGPGMEHPVLYQIHRDYILEVHGKTDGWLYVLLPDGELGWVMSEFTVALTPPASG